MKSLLCCLIIALTTPSMAQNLSLDDIQPLKIGDTVPDVLLSNIVNYPGGKARLSDFKGKLLILDYWGTGCGPCIAGFARMENFQKQFPGQLQVLAVNINDVGYLKKFGFPGNTPIKKLNESRLPFVVGSDELKKLVPTRLVPYYVWINGNGKVIGMTNGYAVNTENIQAVLAGKQPNLPTLKIKDDYDFGSSILEEGGGRQFKNILYFRKTSEDSLFNYSLIAKLRLNNDDYSRPRKSKSEKVSGRFITYPIVRLFFEAYRDSLPPRSIDRIIVDMLYPESYFKPADYNKYDYWLKEQHYSYEIRASNIDQAKMTMQKDLQRFFGITARIEKRKIPCLVLRRTTTNNILPQVKEPNQPSFIDNKTSNYFSIKNYYIGALADHIQIDNYAKRKHKHLPFLDETDLEFRNNRTDIIINTSLSDIGSLDKELQKYGIGISVEPRYIDVLVLSKKTR